MKQDTLGTIYLGHFQNIVTVEDLTEKFYHKSNCLTLSQTTNFRLFQTEFADDNSKLDNNGRKFSKGVENTVGKGEIARNEQFLLFPQWFQKTCASDT